MFQRISRAFVKKPDEAGYKLFVRDFKPNAVQGDLISSDNAELLLSSLQRTGLNWIWESTRTGPPLATTREDSPEHRSRQELTEAAANELIEDVLEANFHGFRRFVALYGGTDELLTLTKDEDLHEAVEAFTAGQSSPLRTLIVQFGDVAPDVIYFPEDCRDLVSKFLESMGRPAVVTMTERRYREMKGEELETVVAYLSCAEHDH